MVTLAGPIPRNRSYHLLYSIDLDADQDSLNLVGGVLDALDFKFSDDAVKVDTSTKNAARITKFYGTTAKKGDDLPERPHRASSILKVPEKLFPVSRAQLEEIAGMKPEEPRNFRVYSGGNGHKELDPAEFIARHNISVRREGAWKNGGRRWILEECPWGGHTDNAAYIVQQPTGEIAAGCHHDSCQQYRWPDLRVYFEPDAYERKEQAGRTRRSDSGDNNDNSDNEFQDLADLPDPEEFPLSALPVTVRQFVREAARAWGVRWIT